MNKADQNRPKSGLENMVDVVDYAIEKQRQYRKVRDAITAR